MFSGCQYPNSNITRIALRWTPQGKRPRGRPKTTWRRTIEYELKEIGMTWEKLKQRLKTELDGVILWRLYAPTGEKRIGR
jgi:hypothetical protein